MSTASQQLHRNGGWCWFQDPRVVVDNETGKVVFATIANVDGIDGASLDANIDVTTFDPGSGEVHTSTVGNIPTHERGDDHNVAAIWQRPDGKFLTVYTGHCYGLGWGGRPHGSDKTPDTFYRISKRPHDATQWDDEQIFRWPSHDPVGDGRNGVTYSNLHYLADEGGEKGRLYNIARASGQIWQIATSDDWGETGPIAAISRCHPEGGRAYSNGYMKFCSNGRDRIDFITTEAHPRDYNNGVYHGYIQNGQSFNSQGELVDADTFSQAGPTPEAFSQVFAPGEMTAGEAHTAWTVELGRTAQGELVALFLSRFGDEVGPLHVTKPMAGTADHRIYFATYHDGQWQYQELAKMGAGLLDTEEDYTGLGAIDQQHGRRVYISTPIDPRNDTKLAHHEIFCGECDVDSGTWSWTAITQNSNADNLRPLLPSLANGSSLLLWLQGRYVHQTHYSTTVQALPL